MPALSAVSQCSQHGFVVGADPQVLDDRLAVVPPEHRHGRPGRFGGQVHPYHAHQHRLRPFTSGPTPILN